jgi:syntaxin 8
VDAHIISLALHPISPSFPFFLPIAYEAAMANPNQYFLLADHIKLSLLERQRAIALNLEPTSQDGHISRSLESLREGVEAISKERIRLEEAGETS